MLIGQNDGGRHITRMCRQKRGPPHVSLTAAFVGKSGDGLNAFSHGSWCPLISHRRGLLSVAPGQPRMLGKVDLRHPARTERPQNGVPGKSRPDGGRHVADITAVISDHGSEIRYLAGCAAESVVGRRPEGGGSKSLGHDHPCDRSLTEVLVPVTGLGGGEVSQVTCSAVSGAEARANRAARAFARRAAQLCVRRRRGRTA